MNARASYYTAYDNDRHTRMLMFIEKKSGIGVVRVVRPSNVVQGPLPLFAVNSRTSQNNHISVS